MTRLFGNAIGAALGIACLSAGSGAFAQGMAIIPGGANVTLTSGNDSGTTVPGSSSVLIAERTGSFTSSGGYGSAALDGTYISDVFQNTTYGTYSFYYQFTNNSTASSILTDFAVNGFSSATSSVGFTTDSVNNGTIGTNANTSGTTVSTTTPSTYAAGGPGVVSETGTGTINFDFTQLAGGGIAPGAASTVLYVATNATSYTVANGSFQGGASANTPFGVYTAGATELTPEPGSLALLIPGVLGAAGMLRRRKRV